MAEASARDRILARLRQSHPRAAPERPDWVPPLHSDKAVDRFAAMLEASHAEVLFLSPADWPERLRLLLGSRGIGQMLFAPATGIGRTLADSWRGLPAPSLIPYDRPVECLKPVLVHGVDAAITSVHAGIADTGSLVLWPDAEEPRLMSLLPPLHIAVIRAETIADNLAGLMAREDWRRGMPTNLVLVSGPSKTADIEQTLAYGVHGPKELLVLILREPG